MKKIKVFNDIKKFIKSNNDKIYYKHYLIDYVINKNYIVFDNFKIVSNKNYIFEIRNKNKKYLVYYCTILQINENENNFNLNVRNNFIETLYIIENFNFNDYEINIKKLI